MSEVGTLSRMGRNKKKPGTGSNASGGPHKTPRTSVQVPNEWLAIARKRAGAKEQPVLWYLIRLIQKDAIEAGIPDLPPLPWEQREEADE